MNIDAYLRRLHYDGPTAPSAESLRRLHRAHMLEVPFENLDIVPLHRPLSLDEGALWDKLIERRRGGFCYELNGSFAWLLKQMGFRVTCLNGRVFNRQGKPGPDFDHMALLVDVPRERVRWLADVGFGDSFVLPLRLEEGEQPEGSRAYRLEPAGDGYIVWQLGYDAEWERQYLFDVQPRRFPEDYQAACLYHQRSPESHFTRQSIVSKATPDGRISLETDRLIITTHGQRSEQPVDQQAWPRLLKDHFGIVL